MLVNKIQVFRKKLQNEFVTGTFSRTSDPLLIEIMGYAGFDFVVFELEQGSISVETIQNLIRTAQIGQLLPILNVKADIDSNISRALDLRPAGLYIQKMSSVKRFEEIIKLVKTATEGPWNICRFIKETDYEYIRQANKNLIIVQLEGIQAIENLNDFIKTKEIDIVFIDLKDLSRAVGANGHPDHPKVEARMKEIIKKCIDKGVSIGTFVDNIINAQKWREIGVRFIVCSVDIRLFYEQCCYVVENIRPAAQLVKNDADR